MSSPEIPQPESDKKGAFPTDLAPQSSAPKGNPRVWVFSTYFAEGLPYSIVRLLSSVYFTDVGAKESVIGYLNFLGIPWNFKFLWAPFLDIIGTKRLWLIIVQVLITALTLVIAAVNLAFPSFASSPESSKYMLEGVALLLVVMAFLSATNDVASDGYYMEGLPNPKDQATFTGYRVFAYRLAMILVRSGIVASAAWAISILTKINPNIDPLTAKYQGWFWAFCAAALSMLIPTLLHIFKLPKIEQKRTKRASVSEIFKKFEDAFVSYTKQEKFLIIIVFIIFYKVGDEVLFSMSTPFLLRELQLSKENFAWIGGLMGAFGAIAGASLGGVWIQKSGLKKAIWPLTLIMNLNIWAYVWLAWTRPMGTTTQGIATIAAVHTYEMFAGGMGTAVLTVYLLRTCSQEFKASHFAIGSAIMSLFGTFFGGYGGKFVEHFGYLNLYLLAFALTIPSMALLFVAPIKDEPK